MKTYLVTGANFVKYMLEKYNNINIVILDSLTYAGNLKTIEEELKNPRVGNLCSIRRLPKILRNNLQGEIV